jgi:[ribosomal protein S5]-alanine N-acetyltransferase
MDIPHIIFETERLIVQQYEFEINNGDFFALNGDEEIMRYIRGTKSREECDKFLKQNIESYKTNPLMGRWAVYEKESRKFVGSFAFIPVEGTENSQLGYALLKDYWGKGYATELTKEGLKYIFSKTDLNEIYGITQAENTDSQKVLIKAGFTFHEKYKEEERDLYSYIKRRGKN